MGGDGRASGRRRTSGRSDGEPDVASRPRFTRGAEDLAERQRMMTRVYLLGASSWVSFAAVDLYASMALAGGAHAGWLLGLRAIGSLFGFGGYFLLRRFRLSHRAMTVLDLVVFVSGGSILGLMAIPFGGITSTFVQGVMVLAAARTALLPSPLARALPVTLATAAAFPVTLAIAALFFPAVKAQWASGPAVLLFVHNFLFTAAVATFGAVGSDLVYSARKQVREATRLGGYRLKMRIASGNSGEVWLARQDALDRHVALKVLKGRAAFDEEKIRRFEREARAASRLTHPNTVRVYDFGASDDGVLFIAMELLDGLNLDALVDLAGPLPAARTIHFARQACGSLAEAHDHGIVHRDVKPANLFVAEAGGDHDILKLLDFGLARATERGEVTVTESNKFGGTPAYMAPEVVENDSFDSRSDLYGLGAVLYFMVTGTVLFPDRTVSETLMLQVGVTPDLPSVRLGRPVPADLERVIMKCLAKDPGDRYASAQELDADLARCADAGRWKKEDATMFWRTLRTSMSMRVEKLAS